MNQSVRFRNAKHMKHVIARAIACSIMLLVLPSCGIPPLRHPEPGPGLPTDFNGTTSPENSAQLGIEEFYNDRMLTCLIEKALLDNRELKILNEEVQIAGNEVLARSGAYLPFVTVAAGAGLNRYSRFTEEGAGILDDAYLPGKHFTNPSGNFGTGVNLTWQLDIYRQLRNARDAAAQRYVAASEKRNYFVTTLVADIAENFYRLMGLDKRLENLDQIIELQKRSLEIAKARKEAARSTELGVLRFQAELQRNYSEKLIINQTIIQGENRINFLVNRYPQRVERDSSGFYDLKHSPAERGSALAATSEPTRYPPGRARAGGCRARREGRPGQLLSSAGDHQRRWPPVLDSQSSVRAECRDRRYRGWPGRAVGQQESDQGPVPHRERQAIAGHLQLPARHPPGLHPGHQPRDHGGELQQEPSRSRSSS